MTIFSADLNFSPLTGSPEPIPALIEVIRITYEIYSSVLKPATCGLCAG